MAAPFLCYSRRVFSSGPWLKWCRNRNQVVAPIIDQGGVGLLWKEAESSENWELFKSWRLKSNKIYKSKEETLHRYKLFCETKKHVDMRNRENRGYKSGLTFFSDLTPEDLPPGYPGLVPLHELSKYLKSE